MYVRTCMYVCLYIWACGMFDFHRSDRGSNPGDISIMITTTFYCDAIGRCLKTICHGFTQAM